ncbi:hypothetical protein ACHAW5_001565 [Stephanodiscus triporus]|uniref:Uncharacterized protein n=1 Tax=Stephanodiscus triporus TaxID=2934178 RepID=A0ABD3NHU1_9STRA
MTTVISSESMSAARLSENCAMGDSSSSFSHRTESSALRSAIPRQLAVMAAHRPSPTPRRTCQPQLIATISAGFAKGDYLIREESGFNVYFDFLEEAYNFACEKGFARMPKQEEMDYMTIINRAHKSVPGGCRYNTGRLIMVLRKKLVPVRLPLDVDETSLGQITDGEGHITHTKGLDNSRAKITNKDTLKRSTSTLPTESDTDSSLSSGLPPSYSSASTSYADSWD